MTDPMQRMQDDMTMLSGTVSELGTTVNQVSNRTVAMRVRSVPAPGLMLLNATRDITVTWPRPMPVDGYFVEATAEPGVSGSLEITTVSTTAAAAVIRVKALAAVTATGNITAIAHTLKQSSA